MPSQVSLSLKTVQEGAAGTWDLQMTGFTATSDVLARTNTGGVLEISGRAANVQVAGRTIGLRAADITELAIIVEGEVKTIDLRAMHGSDFRQLARPGAFSADGFDVSVYDKDGANEIFGSDDVLILDRLEGGGGNDTIRGGLGDDFLNGGEGKDSLYGGAGNDVLLGDLYAKTSSVDRLEGNEGDDTFRWGEDDLGGADELIGGSGADTFDLRGLGDAISKAAKGTTLTIERDADDDFDTSVGSWTNGVSEIVGTRIYDKVTQGNVTVKVLNLNTPPELSDVANQTALEDGSAGVEITVNDQQTPAGDLKITVTSSNSALLPNDRVEIRGTESVRTLVLRPAENQSGKTTLTVTLSDGAVQVSRKFDLTVMAVNDAPAISAISAISLDQDNSSSTLPFRISDLETAVGKLKVTAVSSNEALIPSKTIKLAGTTTDRTIQVTPAADQFGQATITVKVSDGVLEVTRSFDVTVNRVVRDLQIDLSGGQALTMKATGGKLVVLIDNVADSQYATMLAKHVRSIVINGGNGNNKIDLSGVTAVDYKNLFRDFTTGATHDQAKFGIVVHGHAGDDVITGSALADDLFGDDGKDSLTGGKGTDKLFGGLNNDTLNGGDDGDQLSDLGGDNQLNGDNGDDSLVSGQGNDTLKGGAGNDTLTAGLGDDSIDAGAGTDQLIEARDTNFTLTTVSLTGVGSDKLATGLEQVRLTGGDSANTITTATFTGSVTLLGGAGNDTLIGGSAKDVLRGDAGLDSLIGGAGDDSLVGGEDDDYLQGDAGKDTLDGGDGRDSLLGGKDNDSLIGGSGNDTLNGGANNDTLMGGSGEDALSGFDGNDSLEGHDGNDTLIGGKGNDSLRGGAGNDLLRGDVGTDISDGQEGEDIGLNIGADRTDVIAPATELVQDFMFTADWIDRV